MKTVLQSPPVYEKYVEQYFNKTLKFVHETTEVYGLEEELPDWEIMVGPREATHLTPYLKDWKA